VPAKKSLSTKGGVMRAPIETNVCLSNATAIAGRLFKNCALRESLPLGHELHGT